MSDRQFNILLQAITAVSGKIDAFEMKTEQKFDKISRKIDEVDKRFDEVGEKITELNSRLTEINYRLNEHTGLIASISQAISDLTSDLGESHNGRITKIEKRTKPAPAR